jgi:hypothetical protein
LLVQSASEQLRRVRSRNLRASEIMLQKATLERVAEDLKRRIERVAGAAGHIAVMDTHELKYTGKDRVLVSARGANSVLMVILKLSANG